MSLFSSRVFLNPETPHMCAETTQLFWKILQRCKWLYNRLSESRKHLCVETQHNINFMNGPQAIEQVITHLLLGGSIKPHKDVSCCNNGQDSKIYVLIMQLFFAPVCSALVKMKGLKMQAKNSGKSIKKYTLMPMFLEKNRNSHL